MVFKDLEGTKQARKELAEKESKTGPMFMPKAGDTLGEMNHLKALLEEELEVNDPPPTESFVPYMNALLEAEMEIEEASPGSYLPYMNINSKSPTYLAFKEKMEKLHKRNLLKSLIKKHGTESFDLSLVDNVLNDEQVENMIMICLKLEQGQDSNLAMPQTDPFGNLY